MELPYGGSFPNLVRNCRWTIVTDRHSWNVSTQNAFSLPFAAILVNCAASGEMHNYCTPHVIKENFENFLIHRCNYILLSQVYCVWQVVKTPIIFSNNPVFLHYLTPTHEQKTGELPYVSMFVTSFAVLTGCTIWGSVFTVVDVYQLSCLFLPSSLNPFYNTDWRIRNEIHNVVALIKFFYWYLGVSSICFGP